MVFWPPALILVAAVLASLIDFDGFLSTSTAVNGWILRHFDWLFSYASFAGVILVLIIFISPLGARRIGGPTATPILSRWSWFAITLCTTIAVGILFWGAAEPLFHISTPPDFAAVAASSPEAARFALSSIFLHWTFTPYAIYAIPALAFALSYYNFGQRYSLGGPLNLLSGGHMPRAGGDLLDAFALFALVAGVAAALGAGVMSIADGITRIFGVSGELYLRLGVTLLIVGAFVISSVSGLHRGIKVLSTLNVRIFIAMALFVFITGPTLSILQLGADGFVHYVITFLEASLTLGERASDDWTRDWTVFFFANWLAWAPVTALFLGRISVGYTVREFLVFNLIFPSIFSIIWMSIFGGAAIEINNSQNGALITILQASGPEAVMYGVLEYLPFFRIMSIIFLCAIFISFVTAMDSNTLSIAGLCLRDDADNNENPSRENGIKIFWGVLIGAVSFIMTSTTGIDGVRMLSNLGGVPGLLVLILSSILLMRLIIRYPREKTRS